MMENLDQCMKLINLVDTNFESEDYKNTKEEILKLVHITAQDLDDCKKSGNISMKDALDQGLDEAAITIIYNFCINKDVASFIMNDYAPYIRNWIKVREEKNS